MTPAFPAFEPGEEPSRRTVTSIPADGYYMQEWTILEHFGTHVDAPAHFTAGGRTSTELSLAELISPAVVINVARRAAREPDTTVTVADLVAYERRAGTTVSRATPPSCCTAAGPPRPGTPCRPTARPSPWA